jgi:dephospho-CoA kinase
VPDLPLFVVTGASGTGKSTVTGPLRRQLPDCEIFDTDALLHVAALGLDTYRARSSASPTTSRSTAA